MDIDYIDVGMRIRYFRRQKRITQEELAFRIESTAAYISSIECGKKKPSLQKLVQISEVLGVTVNDFIYTTTASVPQSLGELARLSF
jgi:transcriptional regulator with XRE-family HTH domain